MCRDIEWLWLLFVFGGLPQWMSLFNGAIYYVLYATYFINSTKRDFTYLAG